MERNDTDLVAYRRVSTDKQGRSGLGLEAQEAAIREYAQRTGCTIIGEFTEVETGKISNRPELAKAIATAKKRKAAVIIAKLDRISRRVHFISGLMEAGVDFFAADSPSDEPFITHVKASFAEEEARKISQRTKSALAALKARGVKLGKPENLTDDARAKGASQNRDQAITANALVVPTMQALRSKGNSLAAIADRLNERGLKTRSGGTWSAIQVKRVLDRVPTGE
jgi:DNA invertase Pin-like site-specific DNA recombinase